MNTAEKREKMGRFVKVFRLFIVLVISGYACTAQSSDQNEEVAINTTGVHKPVLVLSSIAAPLAYSDDTNETADTLGLIEGSIVYREDVPYLVLYKKDSIQWADVSLHNRNGYFIDQIFLSELPPGCQMIRTNLKDKNLESKSCFIRVKLDGFTKFYSILTR